MHSTFWKIRIIKFLYQEENRHFFNLNVSSKMIFFFDWDLDWRNQASTNGEKFFEERRDSKPKTFSAFVANNIVMEESKEKTQQSNTPLQL